MIALAGCRGFLDERAEPGAPAYPGWMNADGSVKNVATWKSFNDSQLDRLIDQALANNQDLLKGQAQIREARALLRAAGADYVPQPGFAPGAQRSRTSENTTLGTFGQGGITSSQFKLPLTMSYEMSLWGRLENSRRKAEAIAEGAAADYAAGKLLIASEVATAYFNWQSLREEQALLEDTVRARQESLTVLEKRFKAGLEDREAAAQAKVEIATDRADAASLSPQIARTANALAVLCGQSPEQFASLKLRPLSPPPAAKPNLPADVLGRRPDVASAMHGLRAAIADEQLAKAAFFPTITLTGSTGYESASLSTLLNGGSAAWSFGPTLTVPLPDGGRRKSNLEASQARFDAALADWRQTMLVALREVEDSLANGRGARDEYARLGEAETAAKEYLSIASSRYSSGLTNYLNVVDAKRSLLGIQRRLVQIRRARYVATIDLIKALGGDWK